MLVGPRNLSGFSDPLDTYLLPPNDGRPLAVVAPTDAMCQFNTLSYAQAPMLKTTPGSRVILQYNENGHITKPENNSPGKSGTGKVYVYGVTFTGTSDLFLDVHNVWDVNGNGRDDGRLLGVNDFDDSRCYQYSDSFLAQERALLYGHPTDPDQGDNLWCQAVVDIPGDLVAGSVYSLYWVWDWPTVVSDGIAAKAEIYTSCLDIVIQ